MNDMARYFHDLADEWESYHREAHPVQGAVARIAGVKPGACVLDVGCGTGTMEPTYLECGVSQVVAIDIAPRMIEIARRKFSDEPTITFECRDVLTYEDANRFDSVVVYNAYPHFLDKAALAQKAARLLLPGGRFVVAHSMSKEVLNKHHSGIPAHLTSDLATPSEEARVWQDYFTIDAMVDSPFFYCFGGVVKDGVLQ